jgi:hypothetical protein
MLPPDSVSARAPNLCAAHAARYIRTSTPAPPKPLSYPNSSVIPRREVLGANELHPSLAPLSCCVASGVGLAVAGAARSYAYGSGDGYPYNYGYQSYNYGYPSSYGYAGYSTSYAPYSYNYGYGGYSYNYGYSPGYYGYGVRRVARGVARRAYYRR